MKTINYQNTVIYKIVCNDLNIKDIYVGHTTDFIRRKSQHKRNCDCKSKCNMKVYEMINKNGKWDNWSMIEIEKYPCNDGNEARSRERYYYELLNANLNMLTPIQSNEEILEYHKKYNIEYYQNHKERLNEISKEYRIQHKDILSNKAKTKINCCCGCTFVQSEKSRHIKSKKHIEFISSQSK